jgi:hopanoid C-3 methylase
MDVLLLRPRIRNERFGLGPFFRVEPLGLEYVAAALMARGFAPRLLDERFTSLAATRRAAGCSGLIGLSCMHALDYDDVAGRARALRRAAPEAFIAVGGHAASAFTAPLEDDAVDAVVTDDGEAVLPALAAALAAAPGRRDPALFKEIPGLRLRTPDGWIDTPPLQRQGLDAVPLPARDLVAPYRGRYHCLLFKPVWLLETARGCPFRCSFCSVWPLYGRSFRERSIETVAGDLQETGDSVFIVDDLFWHHPERSLALARELKRRHVRKRWILVQSRTDLVARHAALLEAWRPIARDFDIFFGLESPSDRGLASLDKDASLQETVEAARVARALRYGVTGNFVVDPDWGEEDFKTLWDFVAENRLERAGYTILTPLPGTALHRDHTSLDRSRPWEHYDMHHLLWEPRLGKQRFLELYAETWRRSILNLGGQKRWSDWAKQVRPSQIPYLTRVLLRTQRMMRPRAYWREHGVGV